MISVEDSRVMERNAWTARRVASAMPLRANAQKGYRQSVELPKKNYYPRNGEAGK